MELEAKLVPIKTGKYYEQILMSLRTGAGSIGGWYPSALLHIDTFWEGTSGDNSIYHELSEGVSIEITLKIETSIEHLGDR